MSFSRKRFGQHFLEPAWVGKLLRAIAPAPDQTFLEIGPGHGALTRPLTERAHRVIAFEIDRDLVSTLQDDAPHHLRIVEGDFLRLTVDRLRDLLADNSRTPLRVVGNLPYNIASPILFKLIEFYAAGIPLRDATVMLQREVAERLLAVPGTRDYGILTILVGHRATIEPLLKLPPGAFRPPPRVHSALVKLTFHPPDPPVRDPAIFTSLVQAIFTRRRKTLTNALLAFSGSARLAPGSALQQADLDGTRRPETFTIAELGRLADVHAARSEGRVLPEQG